MFEKILYPTDFSDVSRKALDYIKQLQKAGTKEVVVLHVIDERELSSVLRHGGGVMAAIGEIEEVMETSAKKETATIETELKKSGFDVKIRIKRGIPFTEILKAEEEEEVSAVVIGSHGKSLVKEMLLGSVSEKVIRKSTRPVLVVRR